MRVFRAIAVTVFAAALVRASFGCSSSSASTGSACTVPSGACHDCAVSKCGNQVSAAFGAQWQQLDFSGGACADLLSCQCGCAGDLSCITTCTENASEACKASSRALQTCLDGACVGCRSFGVAPQPSTTDAGIDATPFDAAFLDSTPADSTPEGAPGCVENGGACFSPDECCSHDCASGGLCAP